MPTEFTEYWYKALASPEGLCLSTTDREAMRQKLYAARAEVKDAALDELSLVLSPVDASHVWIVKRKQSDANGETE